MDSLDSRTDARTHGRTDTQVILYSVQCYALHWTDKNGLSSKHSIFEQPCFSSDLESLSRDRRRVCFGFLVAYSVLRVSLFFGGAVECLLSSELTKKGRPRKQGRCRWRHSSTTCSVSVANKQRSGRRTDRQTCARMAESALRSSSTELSVSV